MCATKRERERERRKSAKTGKNFAPVDENIVGTHYGKKNNETKI